MNERLRTLMGLLNTPMNQGGGLLGNIPQGALLGAAMYGQGIKGKDPLAGLFPAYMQTAQLQKLMTPDKTNLQKNIEALGYKPGTPEYDAAFKKGLFKDSSTTLSKNLIEAGFVKGTSEYEEAMMLRTLPEGTVPYSKFGKLAKRDESLSHANFATSGIDPYGCVMITDTLFPSTLTRGNIGENIHGRQNLGAIIWKAKLDENIVLTQDNVHHVDKGAFTTSYPIADITNNFDKITREFGANQT